MNTLKFALIAVFAVVLTGMAATVAHASGFRAGDAVSVPATETVDGTLFAAGSSIDVAGTVNGDVYCAGQTVTISGTVNGDVICAGSTLIVSGHVNGNIRVAGQTVTLSGNVAGNASVAASDFVIDEKGVVGRDLLGGSSTLTINGQVGRDMVAAATTLTVNGQVGRNIDARLEAVTVGATGRVGGSLDYTGPADPTIATGGLIVGKIARTEPQQNMQQHAASSMFGWALFSIVSMVLLAMALVVVMPRAFQTASTFAWSHPGTTTLVGVVTGMVLPFAVVVLFMTVFGIPLAILLIFAWIVAAILTMPFVAYLVGRLILRRVKSPYQLMLVGSLVLSVVSVIPFVGFLAMMVSYFFGLGMMLTPLKPHLKRL